MKSSRMFKGSIVLLVISLLILFTTSGVLADGDECNHPETIKDYRWGNYDDLAYDPGDS